MKKLYLQTAAVMAMTLTSAFVAKADTWDGSTDRSWFDKDQTTLYINSAAQFAGLAEIVNSSLAWIVDDCEGKTIILNTDIDLNNREWTSIGRWTSPGVYKSFKGTFDGNGHVISNVYVEDNRYGTRSTAGLFGYSEGTIKNLTVYKGTFDGTGAGTNTGYTDNAGAICANNYGYIIDCNAIDVTVTTREGHYAGAICGHNQNQSRVIGCLAYNGNGTTQAPMVYDGQPAIDSYFNLVINETVIQEEGDEYPKKGGETTGTARRILPIAAYENHYFFLESSMVTITARTLGYEHHLWEDFGYYMTTGNTNAVVSVVNDEIPYDQNRLLRDSQLVYSMPASHSTLNYNIEKVYPTGIDKTPAKAQRVYATAGRVVVENAAGATITAVDMTGRTVYSAQAQSARHEIALRPGFYIVNGKKVIVR